VDSREFVRRRARYGVDNGWAEVLIAKSSSKLCWERVHFLCSLCQFSFLIFRFSVVYYALAATSQGCLLRIDDYTYYSFSVSFYFFESNLRVLS